ncbi:MAG: hypothetical protein ACREIP_02685, partial [Alphaproteobacteria bacterium]
MQKIEYLPGHVKARPGFTGDRRQDAAVHEAIDPLLGCPMGNSELCADRRHGHVRRDEELIDKAQGRSAGPSGEGVRPVSRAQIRQALQAADRVGRLFGNALGKEGDPPRPVAALAHIEQSVVV